MKIEDEDDLREQIDKLYAYHQGCVSSGSNDPDIKAMAIAYLKRLAEDRSEFRRFMMQTIHEQSSNSQIDQGYGSEDIVNWIQYVHEELMEWDFPG